MKEVKGAKIYIDTNYIKSKLPEEYKDYNVIIGDVKVDRTIGEIEFTYFVVDGIDE